MTLPRGWSMTRPLTWGCGIVLKPQLYAQVSSGPTLRQSRSRRGPSTDPTFWRLYVSAAGMLSVNESMCPKSARPASRSSTDTAGSSERRRARTQPADPAPTMM